MERFELARRLGATARSAASGPAVIAEASFERFRDAFAAAASGNGPVFLADPAWGESERAALAEMVAMRQEGGLGRGWLMVPTGGTSGRTRFARHDGETIGAAVRGFAAHFGFERIHCVGLLPLHHVSGLMAWMRSSLTGGTYLPWDGKKLIAGIRPELRRDGGRWCLSVVPTQLQRMLAAGNEAIAWLRGFDAILVGGGPAWTGLLESGAAAGLPLAPSYGLTETAAMAAALRPKEFLAGARSCGLPLPHVRLDLTEEGAVRLAGTSLFRGYYPQSRPAGPFLTEDSGAWDEQGGLRILGRRDALIITGGKKVDPAEVEAALRASGQFSDLAVLGLPDPEWGQAVVACYPAGGSAPDLAAAAAHLAPLAAFKRPRRYLAVPDWPRNAQGKLNRPALAQLAVRL